MNCCWALSSAPSVNRSLWEPLSFNFKPSLAVVISRCDVSRHTESTDLPTESMVLSNDHPVSNTIIPCGRKGRREGPTECVMKAEVQSLG